MEPITTYTSSDGKVTPIVELNNFHLVNAFAKVSILTVSEDGAVAGDAKDLAKVLKDEIFKRMDNRPTQA